MRFMNPSSLTATSLQTGMKATLSSCKRVEGISWTDWYLQGLELHLACDEDVGVCCGVAKKVGMRQMKCSQLYARLSIMNMIIYSTQDTGE